MRIGFIGTGNMGSAIIKGYAASAKDHGDSLLAYNRTAAKAEALKESVQIEICKGIEEIVKASDILFLCVEPKNYDEVMPEISEHFGPEQIFVSIAAGISIAYLESHLGSGAKIIRTMPNTPIMHGLGATAMVRNSNVSDSEFDAVKRIFEAGGIAGEVTEDLISAVIGVSGSSPAYTYMYMNALINAGIDAGLDPDMSRKFAAQAVMGAARMLLSSEESPSELCNRVCTPGGTTIEAVKKLRESDFEKIVKEGAEAAINRSKEMSR